MLNPLSRFLKLLLMQLVPRTLLLWLRIKGFLVRSILEYQAEAELELALPEQNSAPASGTRTRSTIIGIMCLNSYMSLRL